MPRPLPLVYIGNQYDRDEAFSAFFTPRHCRLPPDSRRPTVSPGCWTLPELPGMPNSSPPAWTGPAFSGCHASSAPSTGFSGG
jgi:hypothetical protein